MRSEVNKSKIKLNSSKTRVIFLGLKFCQSKSINAHILFLHVFLPRFKIKTFRNDGWGEHGFKLLVYFPKKIYKEIVGSSCKTRQKHSKAYTFTYYENVHKILQYHIDNLEWKCISIYIWIYTCIFVELNKLTFLWNLWSYERFIFISH